MTEAASVRRSTPPRLFAFPLLVIAGFMLLQTVWILAVPPFRASDEFDHAYRAAAVARGEWIPPAGAGTRGGGAMVAVPEDLVTAARPLCVVLPYTHRRDCWPASHRPDGLVTVGSGAGRYNPLFYAVIGTAALPFHGSAALYVMRVTSAALCCGMFALALAVTRTWARTRWPFVALVVACTPVVMFSSAVAAPNGLEILAGLTFWSAVLAIVRLGGNARPFLVAAATVSGAVLLTLRSLGPLWFLLILVASWLVAVDRRAMVRAMVSRKDVRVGSVVLGGAAFASVWWILAMRPLGAAAASTSGSDMVEGLKVGLQSELGWVLQAIAAFPFRTQLAPFVVYPCAFVMFASFIGAALRKGQNSERIVIELVVLVSLTLPLALTALSFGSLKEVAWQGRYGLPFTIGLLPLAGCALDGAVRTVVPGVRVLVPALVLNLLAQVPGVVKVLLDERASSPLVGTGEWLMPSPAVIASGAGVAAILMMWGAVRVPPYVAGAMQEPPDTGPGNRQLAVTGAARDTAGRARQPAARETVPRR